MGLLRAATRAAGSSTIGLGTAIRRAFSSLRTHPNARSVPRSAVWACVACAGGVIAVQYRPGDELRPLVVGSTIAVVGVWAAFAAFQGGDRAFDVMAGLVALVVAIVSLVLQVSGSGTDDKAEATESTLAPTTTSSTTTTTTQDPACPGTHEGEGRLATVTHSSSVYTFTDTHYLLTKRPEDGQVFITLAGRVNQKAPDSATFYVTSRPDPNTTNTLGNQQGTGAVYPALGFVAGEDGCWSVPQRKVGRPGVEGIKFIYTVVLIPQAGADVLDHYRMEHEPFPDLPDDGFYPFQIDELGAEPLMTFVLDTAEVAG
jgi:hypothetical protein